MSLSSGASGSKKNEAGGWCQWFEDLQYFYAVGFVTGSASACKEVHWLFSQVSFCGLTL